MGLHTFIAGWTLGAISSAISTYLYLKFCSQQRNRKIKMATELSEAIIFPDSSRTCSEESCTRKIERLQDLIEQNKPLMRVIHHLESAVVSLDICVYIITSQELASLCGKLINRGVRVRVIMDDDSVSMSGSQIGQLRFSGAFVRSKSLPHLMHHKFVLIDGKRLLNGSFNWTNSAVIGNHENVIVTENHQIVDKFKIEFERLWQFLEP